MCVKEEYFCAYCTKPICVDISICPRYAEKEYYSGDIHSICFGTYVKSISSRCTQCKNSSVKISSVAVRQRFELRAPYGGAEKVEKSVEEELLSTSFEALKIKTIPVQVVEEDSPLACSVCLTNKINTLLSPCGHACLCTLCLQVLQTKKEACPVCRGKIVNSLPVYLA